MGGGEVVWQARGKRHERKGYGDGRQTDRAADVGQTQSSLCHCLSQTVYGSKPLNCCAMPVMKMGFQDKAKVKARHGKHGQGKAALDI